MMRHTAAIAFSILVLQLPGICLSAGPAPQASTRPAVITWDKAIKHVGETVTVTGPVISTHPVNSGKWLTLNIGKDYPDTDRFLILIKAQAIESDYKNKKIAVTGKVVLYNGQPQIVASPTDITTRPEGVRK